MLVLNAGDGSGRCRGGNWGSLAVTPREAQRDEGMLRVGFLEQTHSWVVPPGGLMILVGTLPSGEPPPVAPVRSPEEMPGVRREQERLGLDGKDWGGGCPHWGEHLGSPLLCCPAPPLPTGHLNADLETWGPSLLGALATQ